MLEHVQRLLFLENLSRNQQQLLNSINLKLNLLDNKINAINTKLINGYIPVLQKGKPNGVASLDATGKVPLSQIPSGLPSVAVWGEIEGDITNQVDLQAEFSNYTLLTDFNTLQGVVNLNTVAIDSLSDSLNAKANAWNLLVNPLLASSIPDDFVFKTLQEAINFYASSVGVQFCTITLLCGLYTENATIPDTMQNLLIQGQGTSAGRSYTHFNGVLTINGHRISVKNILFGNNSNSERVVINCVGNVVENGVTVPKGKLEFEAINFSMNVLKSPIKVHALENYITFLNCDFGRSTPTSSITFPAKSNNGATFSFVSSKNLIVNSGTNTIISVSNSPFIFKGGFAGLFYFYDKFITDWQLGMLIVKGNLYVYSNFIYLSVNNLGSSTVTPDSDLVNFQVLS